MILIIEYITKILIRLIIITEKCGDKCSINHNFVIIRIDSYNSLP